MERRTLKLWRWFKIDFIVWKFAMARACGLSATKFKIDFIVWKRDLDVDEKTIIVCLK